MKYPRNTDAPARDHLRQPLGKDLRLVLLCVWCVLVGAVTARAQENAARELYGGRPIRLQSEEFRLMRMYPSEFHVPAFRRYDMLHALEEQRAASVLSDEMLRDAATETGEADSRRGDVTFAIPLAPVSREGDMLKDVGMHLLRRVLGFGYQYFRESTRKPTLTEFDYLELPQGTGVLRSFNEVEREALSRSERQSRDVHEDRRESGKRPSGK